MKNILYFFLSIVFVVNLNAQIVDFESGNFLEGTIIHDQFADGPCGVKFYLGSPSKKRYPKIAKVGGNRIFAFQGPKRRKLACGAKQLTRYDMPAAGQNVGCYFLTNDGNIGPMEDPLNVVYKNTTNKASGFLLDIDGKESWKITAFDESNAVLGNPILLCAKDGSLKNCSNTSSGSGSGEIAEGVGDGIATYWEFKFPSNKRIKRIEFKFAGSRGTNVGLAFDNFAGCSTSANNPVNDKDEIDTVVPNRSNSTQTSSEKRGLITFENSNYQEGTIIDNQYSLGPCGVKFYIGKPSNKKHPRIAKIGGERLYGFQGPLRNSPSCGINNPTRNDMPAAGQNFGCFFLTDDGRIGSFVEPLNVVYSNTTNKASGYLIDVDGKEQWTITAFDNSNRIIGKPIILCGTDAGLKNCSNSLSGKGSGSESINNGDGVGTNWEFDFPPSKKIKRIEFKFTGTAKGVGLAFDNFSSCSTTIRPNRNSNTGTTVTPTADKPIRYNIGCPPFNQELLSRSFKPKFVGGVNPSAKMEMNLDANFKKIGQTFIDYVNALYPNQQGFTLKFNLIDGGAGSIPKTGRSIANKKISFTAGGNGRTQGDSRFFSNSLKANQWYKIDLKVEFADNRIFSSNCDKEDFFYFKVNSSSNSIQYHNGSSVFKTKRLQSSSISGGRGRIE